jgi:NadR type nicotinamide-nucleotide adenylyltransferase
MPKKVVVIGPESTGKSTLSQALAQFFDCPWVPEYARTYLEKLGRPYDYEDLLEIAKGQVELEEMASEKAKGLVICDTDLHVIKVWSEHKYGKSHDWILDQIKARKYDIYLLTDIDIPWEEDPQREHPQPEMREYFFEQYHNLISATGVPYARISGSVLQRLEQAVEVIKNLSIV